MPARETRAVRPGTPSSERNARRASLGEEGGTAKQVEALAPGGPVSPTVATSAAPAGSWPADREDQQTPRQSAPRPPRTDRARVRRQLHAGRAKSPAPASNGPAIGTAGAIAPRIADTTDQADKQRTHPARPSQLNIAPPPSPHNRKAPRLCQAIIPPAAITRRRLGEPKPHAWFARLMPRRACRLTLPSAGHRFSRSPLAPLRSGFFMAEYQASFGSAEYSPRR